MGGRAVAVCILNKSSRISSKEEAGKAGRWLYAQPWEHWWITWFISPLCHKGYRGSCEQNDALFAGTLLSSHSSLPRHNSSESAAGKNAKNSNVPEKLIAAGSGVGVDWSCVQPRAAEVLIVQQRARADTGAAGWTLLQSAEDLGEGVASYRVSDFSDTQQLKTAPLFSLVWWSSARSGVCKYYSLFHSWLNTWDLYPFSQRKCPQKIKFT